MAGDTGATKQTNRFHSDTAPDLDASLKELNLSTEEVDKFSKAFKDPEFIKLFKEYAKEVSDPKVKAETDMYLRQLESEGRAQEVYGQGVLLIVPTEAFVIKTIEPATGHKAYINVCTSDKVEPLRMQAGQGPAGQAGRQVEIPLSLSHQKGGTDKAGAPYFVWDFVVHPDTVKATRATPGLRKLLVETALDQIKTAHNIQLSADFKVLKTTYKGTAEAPQPHVLTVRKPDVDGKQAAPPGSRVKPVGTAPGVAGMPQTANLPAAPSAPAASGGAAGSSRSAFKFPATKQRAAAAEQPPPPQPHQPGFVHAGGEVTPVWELVHRGEVDLSEAWGDVGRGLAAPPASYPRALVLRVLLPGCTSAAALQLDVGQRAVNVVMPGRYRLDVSLPFPVDDALGKAKLDKGSARLEVTLPTLLPPLPGPAPSVAPTPSTSPGDEQENATVQEPDASLHGDEAAADGEVSHGCAVEKDDNQNAAPGTEQEGAEPSAADTLTEHQRRWLELHARTEQHEQETSGQQAAADGAGAPQGGGTEISEGESYLPSEAWAGPRHGYVFTRGYQGQGYYCDHKLEWQAQQTTTSARSTAPTTTMQQQPRLQPRLHSRIVDALD